MPTLTVPGMLTALIARPPRFGATAKSFDATAARRVKGVTHVVRVPSGVAVVATGFWAARKGREALRVTWDESRAETRGSDDLYAAYRALAGRPGTSARREGDVEGALRGAAKVVEAVFEFPYLAHAPMEPLDAVVRVGADGCDLWAGSQAPTIDQQVVARVVGLSPDTVRVHILFGGGSFGRRATPDGDIAGEAAEVAKAVGGGKPVKVLWTREDDIRGGKYRPLYVHRLRAGLDAQGNIVGWEHRIVGQSIVAGTPFESALVKDGIDGTSVEGAANLPYGIPNVTVELHTTKVGVPVLWWRSVGSTHTAYSTEAFLDELAHAAGRDPLEIRRALLAKHPRHLATLNLAAEKSGWGQALPAGRARGIAVQLLTRGRVSRAYLGFGGQSRPLDRRLSRALGLTNARAIEILSHEPGAPAAGAGLLTGDLIVAIGQRQVQTVDDVHRLLVSWPIGERLTLTVVRGVERRDVTLTPIETP